MFAGARHLLGQAWLRVRMKSSADYWDRRYRLGMTSGSGSAGELARFKARVLNDFVREQSIATVIELGCGDGSQLALATYPSYVGVDVSRTAIDICRKLFAGDSGKSFIWLGDPQRSRDAKLPQADLALSLDVIYHLLEDDVYCRHLEDLFGAAKSHVIIYSSNREDSGSAAHVRHRLFLRDVEARFPEFRLQHKIANELPERSFADFYVFTRASD